MNHEPQYTWNGILEFLHVLLLSYRNIMSNSLRKKASGFYKKKICKIISKNCKQESLLLKE